MRGTFANIRLRNDLAPGTEGPWTTHLPSGDVAARSSTRPQRYRGEGVPLAVLAGQGVRQRVEPRLGGEGPGAAGRAVRPGRELRADPPVEPRGDGHPAAAVRARESPPLRSGWTAARRTRCGGSPRASTPGQDVQVEATRADGHGRVVRGAAARRRRRPRSSTCSAGGVLNLVLRQMLMRVRTRDRGGPDGPAPSGSSGAYSAANSLKKMGKVSRTPIAIKIQDRAKTFPGAGSLSLPQRVEHRPEDEERRGPRRWSCRIGGRPGR